MVSVAVGDCVGIGEAVTVLDGGMFVTVEDGVTDASIVISRPESDTISRGSSVSPNVVHKTKAPEMSRTAKITIFIGHHREVERAAVQ
jgi:hypothetical protein